MNETDLLHVMIERVPFAIPDARMFRRNIINVTATAQGRTWRARNGVVGQADAYVLLRGGRHVEVETKAATGTMREAQLKWQSFCRAFRIPHLELRAEKNETPEATVERWVEVLRLTVESIQ